MSIDTVVIPIVLSILTVAGAIITYAIQHRVQYRATRRQDLIESYTALLAAIAELHSAAGPESFIRELHKAWLFASDDVVVLCQDYSVKVGLVAFIDQHLAEEQSVNPDLRSIRLDLQKEVSRLDGLIALAMRRHVLGRTSLKENWVDQHYSPFHWLPPSKDFLGEIKEEARRVIHVPSRNQE